MTNRGSDSAIGSWEWLEATGGALTRRERLALLPALLRTFGRFSVDRVRLALGVEGRHSLGVAELWPTVPDGLPSRRADEEARELQSDAVLNHAFRTWIFGSALAKIDGAPIEPELFHVGALLHDAGIEHPRTDQCFTHRSAQSARDVLSASGVPPESALQVMDGIGMHITPGLRHDDNPIGFYVQAGAMADLAGIRSWELPFELRERASEAYPRAGVHEVLSDCWRAEAKAVPEGRAQFADAYGGFSRLIRWLPVTA